MIKLHPPSGLWALSQPSAPARLRRYRQARGKQRAPEHVQGLWVPVSSCEKKGQVASKARPAAETQRAPAFLREQPRGQLKEKRSLTKPPRPAATSGHSPEAPGRRPRASHSSPARLDTTPRPAGRPSGERRPAFRDRIPRPQRLRGPGPSRGLSPSPTRLRPFRQREHQAGTLQSSSPPRAPHPGERHSRSMQRQPARRQRM